MDNSFHYPPEVFNLLVETIPLLCKSKPDVLLFFRGAGVSKQLMNDLAQRVKLDRSKVNKYEIVRTIIQRLNEKGDTELRTRREVIKRIVEFEDYSTCWSNDQLKAKGLVSELRRVVNVKDTFTRMSQERQREQQERVRAYEAEIDAKKKKAEQIEKVKKELYDLFSMEDEPQKRGKHL